MKEIKISNFHINETSPVFIIAEAGVNHNGNLSLAKKLIDIAQSAGADAVKFQTWITEEIVTSQASQAEYQTQNTGTKESQFQMLKNLELTFENFKELKNYADSKGILFLSTPDDEKSLEFLQSINLPAIKIGSGEVTNIEFIKKAASYGKPVILSTGMATIEEIDEAIKAVKLTGNQQLILLHCTTQYPTKTEDANLKVMVSLKERYQTIVGYSDHTLGIVAPIAAVALGAKIIEKHFTFDKKADGPDHICSLEPQELKEMVSRIRETEKLLGKKEKNPIPEEIQIRSIVRKTIVAGRTILAGEKISRAMLKFKRSEGTILPKDVDLIVNKKAKRTINADEPLSLTDIN